MPATITLDPTSWDLTLDAFGNVALTSSDDSLAQDAASAIRLFLGEYWWDTTIGVPYLTQILGQRPPLALVKQQLTDAALSVPGVASAQVFITSFNAGAIGGQVQVVSSDGGISAANFAVTNPQGSG